LIEKWRSISFLTSHHFNTTHNQNPKQYVQEIHDLSKTDKALSIPYFVFNATKISYDQIFSPKDLNKKLAKEILYEPKEAIDAILRSAEECENYLRSHDMSMVLQELVDEGLFLNIRGKKKIRAIAPEVFRSRLKERDTMTQNLRDIIPCYDMGWNRGQDPFFRDQQCPAAIVDNATAQER
jgi:hypothetical protein